jgi:hypothetical protein
MENHLGKNPVSGGNPPNDKNSNGKIIDWIFSFELELFICDRVFVFILFRIKKIGIINNE